MKKFGFQDKKNKNYFEGWYFRFTDTVNYAIIFAITKNEEDPHAFIQLFKEGMAECIYKRFDLNEFTFENNTVQIGKNILSLEKAYIQIDEYEIDLLFNEQSSRSHSAMGYLSNAPLDCFQEIILIDGKASGTINKQKTEGTIYIEKTYGNKFPKRWIWLQSNHSKNSSQISFSIGYIPLLLTTVPGWLLEVSFNDERLNFHSLGGAVLTLQDDGFTVKSFNYRVVVTYTQGETIELVGPGKSAKMDIPVYESLTSSATIHIFKNSNNVFYDEYINVGLEIMM